ncbi:hypothetical protein CDAR_239071 [Caerostris darwini]|uniref:Uncharacterized protein n=1 Tax=Caerostris darwini TaxID=1538125 RepID=A0AAV4P1R9_9ARAC|nr:hypothetical protein CDAR_239071 [Caerostris darwini]
MTIQYCKYWKQPPTQEQQHPTDSPFPNSKKTEEQNASRNENFSSNSFPLTKMTDSEVKKASETHEDEISRTPKNIDTHFALQLNQVSA